jgi:translation initiation factor IF-2
LHYENKSLFERFKKPYKKSIFIKSMIKGNISNLKYWTHSPYISPIKNITCNNIGRIIKYDQMNFESISRINLKKGYIIHFNYKSTEEYINKFKRGYSNWFGKKYNNFINSKIEDYFRDNQITKEKLDLLEKNLKLDLKKYRIKLLSK